MHFKHILMALIVTLYSSFAAAECIEGALEDGFDYPQVKEITASRTIETCSDNVLMLAKKATRDWIEMLKYEKQTPNIKLGIIEAKADLALIRAEANRRTLKSK